MPQKKTRPSYPNLRRIFRRRSFSNAQRLQSHWLTQATVLTCEMEPEHERDFWAGVNYCLNDLWSFTVNHDPVFLPRLWAALERKLQE